MWSGKAGFAIDVDLIDHEVIVALNDGRSERVALDARPVADFYDELMGRGRWASGAAPIGGGVEPNDRRVHPAV
ncbi:MAG: DUF5996 family protein [Candidatus Dormibacteraeota bacterium]|nr:DUF5996 family protein [Candidatus Dormibacteraeota bacterium]